VVLDIEWMTDAPGTTRDCLRGSTHEGRIPARKEGRRQDFSVRQDQLLRYLAWLVTFRRFRAKGSGAEVAQTFSRPALLHFRDGFTQ
jgi:hypothetical protein